MPDQPRPSHRHAYDLFSAGRLVGRLAWRSRPRAATGWYLTELSGPAERLDVDPVIEDLARDTASDAHTWEVNAALALDAAERRIKRRPLQVTGRFRRLTSRARVEIYLTGLEARTLHYAVPELPLEAVSEVTVLAGWLRPESLDAVIRRIALLGGRVVAVFSDDAASEAA